MWAKLAKTLESWGLRCSECGGWRTHEESINRRLNKKDEATDMPGISRVRVSITKTKVRTCSCGHLMSSHFAGVEYE